MDDHRCNLLKSCIWDFINSQHAGSQEDALSSRNTRQYHLEILWLQNLQPANENSRLHNVLHLWFFSFPTKLKNYLFYSPRKGKKGGKQEAGLFDLAASSCFHSGHQRSGQIIIGRLEGSRAAGSAPHPPRLGLWMQIRLLFLSTISHRKPIAKKRKKKSCSVAQRNRQTSCCKVVEL